MASASQTAVAVLSAARLRAARRFPTTERHRPPARRGRFLITPAR